MAFAVAPAARQATPSTAADAPPGPAPGILDTIGAAARVGVDATADAQAGRLNDGYEGLASTLADLGVARSRVTRAQPWWQLTVPGGALDREKVWAAADAARRRDPNLFKGLPATREEYEQGVLRRQGGRDADQALLARSEHGIAAFVGSSAADIADSDLGPLQFMAGVGSPSVWVSMLKNGVLNAALEAVKTPERQRGAAALGETMTTTDALVNVGGAFAGGALLTGAGHGLGKLAGVAGDAAQGAFEQAVAKHWDRLPAGLRERWAARAAIDGTPASDALIADMAEAIIGPDRLSEAESGAVSILRRAAHDAAGSPFAPNGAGMAAHGALQDEALARIVAANPATAPATPRGSAAPGMTAISTGVVPGSASDAFMARVRAAESSGNDLAKAATSSAFGRYQFTRGTWLRMYRARFGDGGLSEAQILAKRADGRLQDVLMRDLTERNAAVLRREGVPVTPGNLYVAHFAGEGDAARLFAAELSTPASAVMRAESVAANPFLKRMTVGEVLAWADRKMGGAGVPVRGGLQVAEDIPGGEAARLRAEIDALNAENARIEAELSRSGPVDVSPDPVAEAAIPVDIPLPEAPAPAGAPIEPRAFDPDAPPAEVLALLPALREVVADRGRSLNQIDRLAQDLGASPEEVRRGLTILTREGRIAMRRDNGAFMRKPPPLDGPLDVLDFLAKHGGLRDDEGHGLGLVRQEGRLAGKKGGRDGRRMTRRHGPLLRRNGMSIDQAGELLGEAGYLGGQGEARPTVAQVLAYLDQRLLDDKPRYPVGEEPTVKIAPDSEGGDFAPYWQPEAAEAAQLGLTPREIEEISFAATWHGVALDKIDPEIVGRARDLVLDGSYLDNPGAALSRAINEAADANRWDAVEQTGGMDYDGLDYGWAEDPRGGRESGAAAPDRGGPARGAADAPAGGAPGGAAGSERQSAGPDLADLPEAERTAFLDPDGEAAQAQAMSLEHDARMALDPAIAERQAQEAQLRAEAPLRGENATGQAQDGTMGLGLFDAADQPEFRLDVEGEEKGLGDLLAELDGEAAEIKAAQACVAPQGVNDGA